MTLKKWQRKETLMQFYSLLFHTYKSSYLAIETPINTNKNFLEIRKHKVSIIHFKIGIITLHVSIEKKKIDNKYNL